MKRYFLPILAAALIFPAFGASAQNNDGYYKDVFMDGGLDLSSRKDLPSTRALGLSLEILRTAKDKEATIMDTLSQNHAFIGSENDTNGWLLYPDGAPRFKMMFVNGGSGGGHGRSITEPGRANIRAYVKAGGSYLGNCAGAYVATTGTHKRIHDEYIGIYPNICTNAGLADTYVAVTVPENSPALKFRDFDGARFIDSVYHNGGCYMDYNDMIPGCEALFDYYYEPKTMHGNAAVWAWKENENTGRVICCGPHPEGAVTGPKLQMMEAMLLYAIEGNGKPRIKGELVNYQARNMVCTTEEKNPDFTRIGDRQYHHFTVNLPEGTDTVRISLKPVRGYEEFDLHLFADSDGLAFVKNAKYKNVKNGVDKVLTIVRPKAGTLYVSVFCDTTVETTLSPVYGTQYTGRLDVLNGVPYVIEVQY